jgi:hypothetical protein
LLKTVCRQQGVLVAVGNGEVGGQSVQANGGLNGAGGLGGILREKPCDEAGEQVPAATLGHGGVARGVYGYAAIGVGDEGSRALEHHGHAKSLGEFAGNFEAPGLDLGDGEAGEAGHLAGMGCEDYGATVAGGFTQLVKQAAMGGKQIERIRVDDGRKVRSCE